MNQDELKRTFRDATAVPPPGSSARVWRALQAPRAPRPSPMLIPAFVLSTALGIGIVALVVRVGRAEPLRWSDPHAAVLSTSARASFDVSTRRVTLKSGEVALSSWGGPPLILSTAQHTVRVEAGVAVVRVAGDSVTVSPVAGLVWLDESPVRASPESRRAAGPLGDEVLALESAAARPRRMLARADDLIAERQFDGAVQTLTAVAQLGGLDAEVALYKRGELELRALSRPEAALTTFEAGDARFSKGALSQERSLSAIEACVKLERWPSVLERTEAFLAQHADSERADELRLLHASALTALGRLPEGCAELSRLPSTLGSALRARCP